MKPLRLSLLLLLSCAFAAADEPDGWNLVWSDEFDGNELDPEKWRCQLGNGFYSYEANQWIAGWGNGELQYYTDRPENVSVTDGMLRIRARKESLHQRGYTSGRLRTVTRDGRELFAKRYGRFEIRAKLPTGKGLWPAIWMMPQEESYGGWAASGEIDIMEARGQEPAKTLGTIHYGSQWPANAHSGGEQIFPDDGTINEFHVYAVEWEPGEIRWYVDGRLFSTKRFWWSSSKTAGGQGAEPADESELNPWPAPFDKPFHLILNLAVGGQFLGNPDESTPFPADMFVDYVRVYDKEGGYGDVKPRGEGEPPFE